MKNKIIAMIMIAVVCLCGNPVYAENLPVPTSRKTDVYRYMDYTTITNTSSNQYKLQQNKYVTTDEETGIRIFTYKDEVFYLCAMTSTYGTNIGNCYKITLENGNEFNVMLGDCKADYDDPDRLGDYCYNIDGEAAVNVIEFIIETKETPKKVRQWGSFAALDFFNSDIISIEYTKRLKRI